MIFIGNRHDKATLPRRWLVETVVVGLPYYATLPRWWPVETVVVGWPTMTVSYGNRCGRRASTTVFMRNRCGRLPTTTAYCRLPYHDGFHEKLSW
ncbi:hypothetical protein TIFTF001_035741 [Ficus carica]|uniref:Uncharacterized protein n=1 Tax=Ficus carica TaxID=3494 RepID=A0AA88E319_FICCA|nr:hypothetical protein TIFTF001_035741 [Ficus carica]